MLLVLVVICGCKKASEKASEEAVEIATGGEVKIDDERVTVKSKRGQGTTSRYARE